MATTPRQSRRRRRLSLSVRLSLLALFAALLPLAAVVGFTNYTARNTLVAQGQRSLQTDATANAKLVDRYIQERTLDGGALATLTTTQSLLACPAMPALTQQIVQAHPELAGLMAVMTAVMKCDDPLYNRLSSVRALKVGLVRDSNYPIWTLYNARLGEVVSCVPTSGADANCGAGLPNVSVAVPSADAQGLKQGNQYISDVRNDPKSGTASLDIYTPIKLSFPQVLGVLNDLVVQANQVPNGQAALPPLPPDQLAALLQGLKNGSLLKATQALPSPTVGWLRSTLRLDYIWGIVAREQGANGAGSYAFITNKSGVRVADSNASERFTPAPSLNSSSAQMGTSQSAQQQYQYAAVPLTNISWTYYTLSPATTVTQVANDQVRTSLLAAGAVAVLAILLGLLIGTRMATPVQRSVSDLQGATEALNTLASKQRNSASEQLWVVDACKTGLESVRYLSDAMNQASQRIVDAANWFGEYWDRLTEDQAQRTVQHLRELARYIEEAARRQWASSERLDKAITVTTQVSDQLAGGASAAAESAQQLEFVVDQLQRVVGGRPHAGARRAGEQGPAQRSEEMLPASNSWVEPRGALPALAGLAPRQLPPGPMQPASGVRQPLMPGAWQGNAGSSGGLGELGGYGGYEPQRGPTSAQGYGGYQPQSGPTPGQGYGGYPPQRGPISGPDYGSGWPQSGGLGPAGNSGGLGQGYGQEDGQNAAAGWPGAAGSNRGVRVWEDR